MLCKCCEIHRTFRNALLILFTTTATSGSFPNSGTGVGAPGLIGERKDSQLETQTFAVAASAAAWPAAACSSKPAFVGDLQRLELGKA